MAGNMPNIDLVVAGKTWGGDLGIGSDIWRFSSIRGGDEPELGVDEKSGKGGSSRLGVVFGALDGIGIMFVLFLLAPPK